jgi:UDP-N-acetylglucosamine transferase subunit ALG13
LSEYIYEKETYLKHGFYPYPLAWHSDDKAWLEFSENTPIYTINEAVILVRNSSISISGRTDNEDLKNQASIKFYKYLISSKLHNYNIKQRIFLMRAGENEILKSRNLKMQEWMFLIFHHSQNFEFNSFKKLIKRFIKSILNR